jgi:ribose transport system substrate-binding protein
LDIQLGVLKMKRILLLLLIATLIISCAPPQPTSPQILVSPKGLVLSFWVSVKQGADAAGKDLGVDIIWKGPSLETDIAGQISIVEDNINKKVDAIVIAACDAEALIPVLKKADAAGIPIITIDSNINSDLPKTFVATNSVAAAATAADVLADLIGGEGEVAMIPFVPGATTNIEREKGFLDIGLPKHPGLNLVAKQYSQTEIAKAVSVTEDMVTAHPNLKGIFAANESGTVGCAQALRSRGLAGKIKVVGFDASPNEIEALQDGTIDALIVQNPYKMGYLGVKSAVDVLNGKQVEKHIDTGVYVVTRDNLDSKEIQQVINP